MRLPLVRNDHLAVVAQVLCEFGASQTAKDRKGLNARDYAVKRGKEKVLEFYDHVTSDEEEDEDGDEPSDGLTSTQRNLILESVIPIFHMLTPLVEFD